MLVMVEIAATLSPRNRARITSGTVDMPTASPPSVRIARISAGVSNDGPGIPGIDAFGQGHALGLGRRAQRRAQAGVMRIAVIGTKRASVGSPISGFSPEKLM